MRAEREALRQRGLKVAFTNGCFDLLHAGHVKSLGWARGQADVLIVGLNSDRSVRRIKGAKRPLVGERDRAVMLAGLEAVDYVVVFDEDEPAALLAELTPDVLVKGADWAHFVSGREAVEKGGGRVALAPIFEGRSTSELIRRIVAAYGSEPAEV
ncbi:MAG: adenylyltransferase/cytidyltransferase family protein [Lentisphaerae bacterium]|nr:adenylyltransferase/cytidyltransferase family protein [Lentisphaerota bacterium]